MKRKIILIIVGICIILGFVIYNIYFSNPVERECKKRCSDIGIDFLVFQTSEVYNFAQCTCKNENGSKSLYFDLDTKETLTSNDVLGRVLS